MIPMRGDYLDLAAMIAANPNVLASYGQPPPQSGAPVAVPVPGRNAQMIVEPGQPMPQTPPMPVNQRVDQGFQDAGAGQQQPQGGAGFVDQIMAALQGAAPGATVGTHSPGQGGIMNGIGNFAADAALGMAAADPSATPLSTLSSAFTGALASRQSREDRKRAENVASENTAYKRGRDKADDDYRERRLSIEEKKALLSESGGSTETLRDWRANNTDRASRGEPPMSLENFIKLKKSTGATALTATDKKAVLEADDMVMAGQNAVSALDRALELNESAMSGPVAGMRGYIGSNFGDYLPDGAGLGTGIADSKAGIATEEFQNVVMNQVLENLKATFGGMPTEGERKVLIDVQGSVNKAPAVRKAILERARLVAERRIEFNRDRGKELRGGTFYSPDNAPADEIPPMPSAGDGAAPPAAPQRATNPQTGEVLELSPDGKSWIPAQ